MNRGTEKKKKKKEFANPLQWKREAEKHSKNVLAL